MLQTNTYNWSSRRFTSMLVRWWKKVRAIFIFTCRLAFVSGNRSIYICVKGSEGAFVVESALSGHIYRITAILFHPTDSTLVSAGLEGIFIWDWKAGKLLRRCVSTKSHRIIGWKRLKIQQITKEPSNAWCGCIRENLWCWSFEINCLENMF